MNTEPPDGTDPQTPPGTDENDSLQFGPSDEQLKKELHDYAKALREEFAKEQTTNSINATAGLEDPVSNVEKYTRQFFRQNLPDAAAQVVWLSCNSTSDSVRLRACQIIIKEALEDARAEGDPIKDILADLKKLPITNTLPNN